MAQTILTPEKSYTFSDYFNFVNPTSEIVAEFGYQFQLQRLDLPKHALPHDALTHLKEDYYKKLPHISLNSEAAKREFYISPLLLKLLDYVNMQIDVEYSLQVNQQLKGTIDYVLRAPQNLIVVEAKNADLEKGFSQLAVELIAMDQYIEDGPETLYGTVTVGDVWRFGTLARTTKTITKDIDAYLVPTHIELLFTTLLGVLTRTSGE